MIPEVEAKFAACPPLRRSRLHMLRDLIYATATATPGVGPLREALKWGQPSYHTSESGSGTPIRIDAHRDGVALFVNCQSSLVESWRTHYPHLAYEGQRAVTIADAAPIPEAELAHMIAMALTYHARRKARPR